MVVLAVSGTVVAGSFGYRILGGIVGAAVVAGLAVVTLIHHRRAVGDGG
jgi:hypothetical protein